MTGRHGYDVRPERQNEYFIPGDGISREVIQADICRYLGNDALGRQGYFIRAYRNLTSEMIADLKADSARWEADVIRRADQGYPRANYASSAIHEGRQTQGPSPPPTYSAPPTQSFLTLLQASPQCLLLRCTQLTHTRPLLAMATKTGETMPQDTLVLAMNPNRNIPLLLPEWLILPLQPQTPG
ncbi:hypothetical protein EYZ11_010281 [Aspergillus tanneri]|uniref:Uncharacterized protein n=1 Tax=Aspergillus tanneri TaxID=1220188 RepID=A0A4V3UN94_9EURO|nr:hypothetical protein EYZ11_010281 [Aspergillus tanneri]